MSAKLNFENVTSYCNTLKGRNIDLKNLETWLTSYEYE